MKKIFFFLMCILSWAAPPCRPTTSDIGKPIAEIKKTYLLPFGLAPESTGRIIDTEAQNTVNRNTWATRVTSQSQSIATFQNYQLPSEWQKDQLCSDLLAARARLQDTNLLKTLSDLQSKSLTAEDTTDLKDLTAFIDREKKVILTKLNDTYGIDTNTTQESATALADADKKFNALFDPLTTELSDFYIFLQTKATATLTESQNPLTADCITFTTALLATKPKGLSVFSSGLKSALSSLPNKPNDSKIIEKLGALVKELRSLIAKAQTMINTPSTPLPENLKTQWRNHLTDNIELINASGITIIYTRMLSAQLATTTNETVMHSPAGGDVTEKERVDALYKKYMKENADTLALITQAIQEIPELTTTEEISNTLSRELNKLFALVAKVRGYAYTPGSVLTLLKWQPVAAAPAQPATNETAPDPLAATHEPLDEASQAKQAQYFRYLQQPSQVKTGE